jgi:hypothetical protein
MHGVRTATERRAACPRAGSASLNWTTHSWRLGTTRWLKDSEEFTSWTIYGTAHDVNDAAYASAPVHGSHKQLQKTKERNRLRSELLPSADSTLVVATDSLFKPRVDVCGLRPLKVENFCSTLFIVWSRQHFYSLKHEFSQSSIKNSVLNSRHYSFPLQRSSNRYCLRKWSMFTLISYDTHM